MHIKHTPPFNNVLYFVDQQSGKKLLCLHVLWNQYLHMNIFILNSHYSPIRQIVRILAD